MSRSRPGLGRKWGARLAGYHMQIWLRHGKPIVPILVRLQGGQPGVHLEAVVNRPASGLGLGGADETRLHASCRAQDGTARDRTDMAPDVTSKTLVYPGAVPGHEPSRRYRRRAFRTVAPQIALAGYRLADFLDRALAP